MPVSYSFRLVVINKPRKTYFIYKWFPVPKLGNRFSVSLEAQSTNEPQIGFKIFEFQFLFLILFLVTTSHSKHT